MTPAAPRDAAPKPLTRPMTVADLDTVLAVEAVAYSHPWSRGNFIDSMAACYDLRVFEDETGLLGYFVAMTVVDEVHLLNITVAPRVQALGHARTLLDELCALARHRGLGSLWLEVRPSNARARHVYERYGFRVVGLRKGYYPLDATRREDALVLSLALRFDTRASAERSA